MSGSDGGVTDGIASKRNDSIKKITRREKLIITCLFLPFVVVTVHMIYCAIKYHLYCASEKGRVM